ncbi:hypothetical protein V5O48_016632 [Marasmius crinis-equi]|uniref:F-box domain-containing protein n=1 Tax=Marasmius crinis-equi TaxID=585013 RepID=A0ABR3ERG9_9AGAR
MSYIGSRSDDHPIHSPRTKNPLLDDRFAAEAYRLASAEIPPHIHALLVSGRFPDPSELSSIRSTICDLDEDISTAIKAIEEQTLKLIASELKSYRYHSLLSPIRKLPPEVMSQVLTYAAGPIRFGRFHLFDYHSERRFDATTLSQVCSYWRRLCLDTPEMWGNLVIGTGESHLADHPNCLPLLLTFLERSKDGPLAYKLGFLQGTYSFSTTSHPLKPGTQLSTALFATHAQRVRHLELDIDRGGWSAVSDLMDMFGKQLKTLRHLSLESSGSSDEKVLTSFHLLLHNLPSTDQITTLTLSHTSLPMVSTAFETLPRLATVEIFLQDDSVFDEMYEPVESFPSTKTTLSFLNILVVKTNNEGNWGCHHATVSHLLSCLTAPALTQLTLHIESSPLDTDTEDEPGVTDTAYEASDAFIAFIMRSNPSKLRMLYLANFPPCNSKNQPVLSFVPTSVEELTLKTTVACTDPAIITEFLMHLTNFPEDNVGDKTSQPMQRGVLPHLTHLTISLKGKQDNNHPNPVDFLVSMVESRVLRHAQPPKTPLRYLFIHVIDYYIAPELRDRLRGLFDTFRDDGLDTLIKYDEIPDEDYYYDDRPSSDGIGSSF